MTSQETKNVIVWGILIPSLQRLYQEDYSNILYGVSERNVCARLAHHMENIMRQYDNSHHYTLFAGYYADVEYDKMADGKTKQYENTLHRPKRMISDLLIQSRGYPQNFLAVELKRESNYNKRREDRERLKSMVSSKPEKSNLRCVYDTLVGAFIIYSADKVKIELFENLNGVGEQTNEIQLLYREPMGLCVV